MHVCMHVLLCSCLSPFGKGPDNFLLPFALPFSISTMDDVEQMDTQQPEMDEIEHQLNEPQVQHPPKAVEPQVPALHAVHAMQAKPAVPTEPAVVHSEEIFKDDRNLYLQVCDLFANNC